MIIFEAFRMQNELQRMTLGDVDYARVLASWKSVIVSRTDLLGVIAMK